MRALYTFFVGLGTIGFLTYVTLMGFLFVSTIYGIYLAFSASIILGIIVLFLEPVPLIIGLVMFLCHKDLALMLIQFLTE